MKSNAYYLLISIIFIAPAVFLYTAQTKLIHANATNKCAGPYELLPETTSFNATESPLTIINLYQIMQYLKSFDQQITPKTNIKEIVLLFCHHLLEHVLQIPLINLPNKLAAENLQKRLPDAYNYFINILLFAEAPQYFFDVISAEYESVKAAIDTDVQKTVEHMLAFTKIVIESSNPIDKNALKTIAEIVKYFICKKFDSSCCQEPGFIALLLKDSMHKDNKGINDGVIQLLKESIEQEIEQMDLFLTQPAIIDPLSAFFNRHVTTIFVLNTLLRSLTFDNIQTLKVSPSKDISALLSKAENSILLAQVQ